MPQLTSLKLLNALLLIDQEGPVGRRALAQTLQINDGVARGLLERFAEQGFVKVTERGVKLSQNGKMRLQNILQSMSVKKILNLDKTELLPNKVPVAIHLLHGYRSGMTGIPQRDEAIKAGADGSITIAVRNGRLVVPPDYKDTAELSPNESSRLRSLFNPNENDVIIIGFANNPHRALSGALAAVLSLAQ